MTTTDEWTTLGITYAIRQQIRRGVKTGNWYVQFYKPAGYGYKFSRWKAGSARGGFTSRKEAEAWVQAMRRFGERPWEKTFGYESQQQKTEG